jgi:protocatechuate 3,4-dioxygenase beta subunit
MKNLILVFCVFCFFSAINPLDAQELYSNNNPIYDRAEDQLSNTDTIPDFRSKTNKLKLSGTIFQSDGVTPAENVIVFIEQPDENGDFDLRRSGDDRYVFHRSWVKTDKDGKYTFYTFVPGNDRRYNRMQQIFPIIKEPSKNEVQLESLLFNDDPLLTKRCRKRLNKKGDAKRILTTKKVEGLLVAQKDIVLTDYNVSSK